MPPFPSLGPEQRTPQERDKGKGRYTTVYLALSRIALRLSRRRDEERMGERERERERGASARLELQTWGASNYNVHAQRGGGASGKADESTI